MDTIHDILRVLHQRRVEFVIVGGMAAVVHGSSLVTADLDVCAPFTIDNMSRLLEALKDSHPRHRMSPNQPPLSEHPQTLATFKNLYLQTDLGQLDVLSTIDNVGPYEQVRVQSVRVELKDLAFRVLTLEALIRAKEAMTRTKDRQAVAELRALRERHEPHQ